MSIFGWICFGFFAGLLARAIMPGEQKMGLVKTTLLGVAGSFVGGLLAALVFGGDPFALRPAGFIGAILGALALLVAGRMLGGRKAR